MFSLSVEHGIIVLGFEQGGCAVLDAERGTELTRLRASVVTHAVFDDCGRRVILCTAGAHYCSAYALRPWSAATHGIFDAEQRAQAQAFAIVNGRGRPPR